MNIPSHKLASILFATLLAWSTPQTLRAQEFSSAQPLPGDAAITALAANQSRADVAFGTNQSLLVYEDDSSSLVDTVFGQQAFGSSSPGNHDIHGMLLDSDSRPLLPAPIVIAQGPWDQLAPQVAWNGSEYLVVFESTTPTTNFHSVGIFAVRVSPAGAVIDDPPLAIATSPDFDELDPVVASMNGTWLVAWSGQNANTIPIVEGRTVDAAGNLGLRRTLLSAADGYATSYDLAASQNRYGLVFSHAFGQAMRMRLFDAAANATTAVFALEANFGNRPTLASNGTDFCAVWNSAGLKATLIDGLGNVAQPGGQSIVAPPLFQTVQPRVAWTGSEFLAVHPNGQDLRATTISSAGQVLSADQVLMAGPAQLRDPAIDGAGGAAHVVWTDQRLAPATFTVQPDDLWALRVDAMGTNAEQPVSIGPPHQVRPRFAGHPLVGYLVVYMSFTANGVVVQAQPVNELGQATTAQPFAITSSPERNLANVDVACNGSEFLVTWHRLQSPLFSGPPPLVEARRCRIDGTLLDAAPQVVMEGRSPAVEALGGDFLIACAYEHPIFQVNSHIFARRIQGATGQFLDPSPLDLGVGVPFLDVSALTDRWYIAFHGVRLIWVNAAGQSGVAVHVAGTTSSSGHAIHLTRNVLRDELFLSYESRQPSNLITTSDIRVKRLDGNGNSPDPFVGPLVTAANNAQLRPVGAALGDEYLTAWADHREHPTIEPGLGDVYAGRLSWAGQPLDTSGLPVATSAMPEGAVDLLGLAGGKALYAYAATQPTGPMAGVHRIRTGTYLAKELGSTACVQTTANSSGQLGELGLHGSSAANGRNLRLRASQLPPQQFGFFLVGQGAGPGIQPAGSQGLLCLTGAIGRYSALFQVQQVSAQGTMELLVDPAVTPGPFGSQTTAAGETWVFQGWHRDTVGGTSTSHFTSAVSLMFR